MAYAPQTLGWLAQQWEAAIGSAVFSGIVGDSAHNYGYHRAANEVPSSDYSRQLSGDVNGIDWNAACAIDMSHSTAEMKLITRRFYDSWKNPNDLRLNHTREVIGTLDGVNVIYMDTQSGKQGTSDNSHLWHIHVGGLRSNLLTQHAVDAIFSIVRGESWEQYKAAHPDDPYVKGSPEPAPAPVPRPPAPPWPMNTRNEYFGNYKGPAESHGGANSWERPPIMQIQNALNAKGYNCGAADGWFGDNTQNAVANWQRRNMPGTTYYGQVWWDDWAKLLG